MNPMGRSIPVNPEHVKMQLQLLEAKLGMHQAKLGALLESGKATRKLMLAFVKSQTSTCALELKWWHDAHERQENADRAIITVAIQELESQIFIQNKVLEELKNAPSGLITN